MESSQGWVTNSKAALRISRAVCVVAACGLAVTVFLVLAALARDRPFGSTAWLLIPGVPALALGQIWGIVVVGARWPRTERRGLLSRSVTAPVKHGFVERAGGR